MGVVCCTEKQQLRDSFLTKSLSSQNLMFEKIKIDASNQPLSKHSLDIAVVFTDQSIDLKGVSLINKLPQNQINIIKQFAKNLSSQYNSISDQSQEKQNLLSLKKDEDEQNHEKSWKIIMIDNPIVRLDISSFLFVNIKIWDGTDDVSKILQQAFEKIKPKIEKVQTIGFFQIPFQIGIPIKKFHQKLLQTVFVMIKDQNKKISQLINKESNIQMNELKDKVNEGQVQRPNDASVDQEQDQKKNMINSIDKRHKLNKIVYLTNNKKSIILFSQNLKKFQRSVQNSFLDKSDYY